MVPVRLRLDLDPLRTLLPFLCVPMVLLALGMGLPERILDQRRCLLHTAGEGRKRSDHALYTSPDGSEHKTQDNRANSGSTRINRWGDCRTRSLRACLQFE